MTELLQYIANGLVSEGIYAIVAVGFITIYRVSKVINLARGGVPDAGRDDYCCADRRSLPYGWRWLAILAVTLIGIILQKYIIGYVKKASVFIWS